MSARVAFLAPLLVLLSACSLGTCSLGAASTSARPTPSPTPTPPAVGDACVVGTWTLTNEQNVSGYTWNNQPVSVSGLGGAKLTITPGGDEHEVFDGSQPLQGALPDGRVLAITIRGSYDFRIKATDGQYTETGTATQLPTTATIGGQPVQYHSAYTPGTGTYTCSSSSLTVITTGGVQTDSWSKG